MILFFLLPVILAAKGHPVYTFSVRWPGSVCIEEKCKSQFMDQYDWQRWNIHGLWPSDYSKSQGCYNSEYCSHQKFDPSQLSQSTIEGIQLAWVGLFHTSHSLHKHEYEKHGTCIPNTTQDEFFQLVLGLSEQFNVYQSLEDTGIVPSDSIHVTRSDFIAAIQKMHKTLDLEIHISCILEGEKYHIVNISFCLDEKLLPSSCLCNNQKCGLEECVSCPDTFFYPINQSIVA